MMTMKTIWEKDIQEMGVIKMKELDDLTYSAKLNCSNEIDRIKIHEEDEQGRIMAGGD